MDGQYWKIDQTMYINNQWQPTRQVTDIFLAVPSSLTSEMIRIRNLYRFMYRQHVYDLEKRRGDCLMKWLILLGFMDLRGRGFVGVQRRSCQHSDDCADLHCYVSTNENFQCTEITNCVLWKEPTKSYSHWSEKAIMVAALLSLSAAVLVIKMTGTGTPPMVGNYEAHQSWVIMNIFFYFRNKWHYKRLPNDNVFCHGIIL